MKPGKGLAMLIVGKGKPGEGSPSEEASEPPAEASAEGDDDYTGVAGDILAAVKSDDVQALATALKALCGMEPGEGG